ncbi:M16 family metallopeptidase [Cellulophaga fucicola]|uniref:Predicted Zn-dependent peptidase n=1 Tax=Cellulophaga fucicola TaxID=76595 RepID=A0A1K1QRP5_9FLAO|nr:pitrilysin family protein [Cellulophaga fucicola]SFW61958.1 Predicted Zn-dependent peptidase [Cellulophaga fucicola]
MKKIYSLLVIALLAFNLQAQVDRSKMPEAGPLPQINLSEPQRFELKNGLKVLVVENHKLPRVSVQLIIDNPPVAEGNKAGVSSFVSSLLGNGSKTISKDDFNEELDFMGARMSFGSESASASSLSKYFPRIMELMADAAINPNFTQEEFDKEKEKILTSLKADEKNVASIARDVQSALAYGKNHPYGELVTKETINNITLKDVQQFYSDYFVPANSYMVIIGDVDFKEVKKLVKNNFVSWTKATPPSFSLPTPKDVQYTQINFVDMPNAVQSEVAVENLVSLKKSDPDYLPALMANRILGGGGSARLFLNLREDKAYTYGAYSSIGNDKNSLSRFRAYASVRNAVTDSAVVELLSEIDKIATTPVSEKELSDAKAAYIGNFIMALEKPSTMAGYALNIETEGLPKDYYKTYLEKINAITVADVENAAKKYFKSSNARIVVTGKGSDVLDNLEKVTFKGQSVPVKYFDKQGNPAEKPKYDVAIPEGVDAKKVLANYIEAIGGKDKLESITSYYIKAKAEIQGQELLLEIKKTTKDQFMQDVSMMGNSMSKQVLDGDAGFMVIQGRKMDLQEAQITAIKAESAPFPELNYINSEVTLKGIEDFDGTKAYVIKFNDTKSAAYDVKTGLKVVDITTTPQGNATINYSDYKEVSGIQFPFLWKQTMGPQKFDFNVTEIKTNEGVSDADFK